MKIPHIRGSSCGVNDIPNEFLKYGGESMIYALKA